ncbi:MAG: ABC transporter ATP-binding protein [Candidatus Diapherotrites archaeon]|uniref:ABC transporter ATP-binding protein n=1 Tax=Candidatus Iainarchaeum sp. TaxID=3101447 RepID=A0A8T4L2U4_9ARCH|nr:ABC transporter ATP-binding protein [Candidatus Diapherotrites archaeon]
MNAVLVSNANKSFSDHGRVIRALENVSLDIRSGEIFGLLGPNGAGKTTLISALCGLLELDSGSVEVFGKNVQTQRSEVIPQMNLVTGFAGLLHGLTVEDLLRYYSFLYPIKDREKAIEEALLVTNLVEKRKQMAYTLSSGYRQRFYIAKALLSKPKLLLMDEPTVGLDVETAIRIRELVSSLKSQGITVLLTTHYMAEAEQLCDRIALISDGKIVALGSVSELKKMAGKPHASLEDTFLKLTKKNLEEEEDE